MRDSGQKLHKVKNIFKNRKFAIYKRAEVCYYKAARGREDRRTRRTERARGTLGSGQRLVPLIPQSIRLSGCVKASKEVIPLNENEIQFQGPEKGQASLGGSRPARHAG